MNREHLTRLRDTNRDALLGDILPFWFEHGIDHQHGGFFNAVDRDGTLLDSDKRMMLTCWRICEELLAGDSGEF